MTADIKYTVKHHARSVKKVATVLFISGVLIFVLLDLIWAPFKGLVPEMQAFAMIYIIPEIFWDLHGVAFFCIVIGSGLWLLRWRTGKIELTDDKLTIIGSYYVSIWLKNMWEVDVRELKHLRRIIRLDSNVDAVQIKFKTQNEFESFREKLLLLEEYVENIKIKTTA